MEKKLITCRQVLSTWHDGIKKLKSKGLSKKTKLDFKQVRKLLFLASNVRETNINLQSFFDFQSRISLFAKTSRTKIQLEI